MLTIWKFELHMYDRAAVSMPKGAKLLHVESQRGIPCIWALVDQKQPMVNRWFRFAGTGHPIEPADAEKYVGTLMIAGGDLVFHVFDLGEK